MESGEATLLVFWATGQSAASSDGRWESLRASAQTQASEGRSVLGRPGNTTHLPCLWVPLHSTEHLKTLANFSLSPALPLLYLPDHPPWPPVPLEWSLSQRRNWPGSWSRLKTRRSSSPPCGTSPGPWRKSSGSSGERGVVNQGLWKSRGRKPFPWAPNPAARGLNGKWDSLSHSALVPPLPSTSTVPEWGLLEPRQTGVVTANRGPVVCQHQAGSGERDEDHGALA